MNYTPVTVISATATSYGKPSSRTINAARIESDSNCAYLFEPTKRDLDILGFEITPGSTIIDQGKHYTCCEVQSSVFCKRQMVCAIVKPITIAEQTAESLTTGSEKVVQETETIQHKLEELHSMLETAKNSTTAQPMIPLIETAIEAHEDNLKNIQLAAELQRKLSKRIILRATGLDTWAKDRHCVGVYYPADDHFVFELEQTKRWFSLCKFLPRVGYLLIPEDSDSKFQITSIRFLDKRPKRTIFTAIPVSAA